MRREFCRALESGTPRAYDSGTFAGHEDFNEPAPAMTRRCFHFGSAICRCPR
ncbi:MAG: hypothetical protein WD872_17420 [Pirellulaceae bacterium]